MIIRECTSETWGVFFPNSEVTTILRLEYASRYGWRDKGVTCLEGCKPTARYAGLACIETGDL